MNLLNMAFPYKTSHLILYKVLDYFKVKNCHVIYVKDRINPPSFTKTFFYSYYNLFYLGPKVSEGISIKPLDEKILKDLIECEVTVLKMMDRLQRAFDRRFIETYTPEYLTYNSRKMFYLKHLRYWNHFLDEKEIDIVLLGNIPHEIFSYIIFQLCKLKNIPTVVLYQTHIDDTVIFFDDFENPNIQLKNTYSQLREDLKNIPESEIQLPQRYKSYFQKQTEKLRDPTPFYMKNLSNEKNTIFRSLRTFFSLPKASSLKNLYRSLTMRLKFEDLIKIIKSIKNRVKIFKKRIKYMEKSQEMFNYYENLSVDPDYSKKYIYVTLHLQPELSTSPLAGVFVYQSLMVQMLSYLLPKNVYLYVKENPKQTYFCRSKSFYDNMVLNPNVKLVKKSANTYKLINNCIAVATCSGTAGLEALFREKPVLLFGTIYYQFATGIFRIKTVEDCQKALYQIIKQNIRPTLKDIKIFLKAMEFTSIEGYSDLSYKKFTSISHEQNIKNISQALIEKIHSLFNK